MVNTDKPTRVIVLIHGFAAHWRWMVRLERYFREAGYRTVNWGYSSWFRPIEVHSLQLVETLKQLDADENVSVIDFVTHSMGCIVTRAALLQYRPRKCGRWVMLAPPNQGSRMANRLNPVVGWLMKPIRELCVNEDSYVKKLSVPAGLEIAVVEATRDFIVDASSTRIPEEKDRIVVQALHSTMLLRQEVAEQCLHFLENGWFDKEVSRPTDVAGNQS